MLVALVISLGMLPAVAFADVARSGTTIFPDEVTNYTEYNDDINKSFNMMGIDYHIGYVLSTEWNASSVKVRYNLNEKYKVFTVDIGHLDNEYGTTAYLQVYLDGVYTEQIELSYDMPTQHYTINVDGVSELMFDIVENSDEYGRYYYGFANGTAYSMAECINAGISVPATSEIHALISPSDSNFPYQKSDYYQEYVDDINKSFYMMGIDHHQGFVIGTEWNYSINPVWYNLGKKYQLFTVDVGHLDNDYDTPVEMQIYFDGEYIESVALTKDMPVTHYTLNVSGVNQLKIDLVKNSDGYGRYYYGFANPRLYTTEDLISSGIETIPDISESEEYKKTNLVVGEYALPYQYRNQLTTYGQNKIYTGDINTSFKMDGTSYITGFVLGTEWDLNKNYAYFNLGGIFDTISMKIGHVDNKEDSPAHVRIKCDGVYVDEFDLSGGMRTLNYTLDVKDVNQLIIELVETDSSYARYYYGFADITTTHTHTPQVIPAENATCTESGKTEGSQCKTCGEILVKQKTTLAKGHKYINYVKHTDATCTADATSKAICENGCGSIDIKNVAGTSLGHIYDNSCDKSCNRCNEGRNITHNYGEYVYNNDATVEKDGTKTHACIVCGNKETVTAEGTKLPAPTPDPAPAPAPVPEQKPVQIVDTTAVFTDVKAGKWYTSAVNYAYSYGFIAGVSDNEFGRDVPVTRGMFITILARIAGVDTSKNANKVDTKFTDVKSGKYYTAAIKWASDNNIVSGLTDTTFGPENAIERQQLCTMIVNFAKFINVELAASQPEIAFADGGSIRKYAKSAVSTCQRAGIIKGYTADGATTFKPTNTATRAEAAQILYVFHKDFVVK